jgi:uncharacterized protein
LILIENGASIKASSGVGNTLLMYAVKVGGSDETVSLILQQYPECLNAMNQNGDTALMFASVAGNISAIKKLISLGARVDTANREGITPFHCAVRYKNHLKCTYSFSDLDLYASVERRIRDRRSI